jgi:glutathione synthase
MARIALLIQKTPKLEDGNYLRLGRELAILGHEMQLLSVDSLRMQSNQVIADSFDWQQNMASGDDYPDENSLVIDHDLLWVLSIGFRRSFLDKIQLLQALPRHVQVVNSVDALMYLKSKYLLAASPRHFPGPETHASPNAQELIDIVTSGGGRWIIKPPAGSLGRDVFLVEPGDSNLATILQHLCGADNDQYTMIQRYLPAIENGEKRVLLAAGKVMGQYLRRAGSDHRTNVSQGAAIERSDLTADETALCHEIGRQLVQRGAVYAGIDLVYPHLIEVNVINPGGLTTIEELTGTNLAPRVALEVTKHLL